MLSALIIAPFAAYVKGVFVFFSFLAIEAASFLKKCKLF
jgi:hypothetical protein